MISVPATKLVAGVPVGLFTKRKLVNPPPVVVAVAKFDVGKADSTKFVLIVAVGVGVTDVGTCNVRLMPVIEPLNVVPDFMAIITELALLPAFSVP